MVEKEAIFEWIKKSKQRIAIVKILKKPMSASEICIETKKHNVSIWFSDISKIMREFQKHGIIKVINPDYVNGKLYCFTNKGREIVNRYFCLFYHPISIGVEYRKYSIVNRSKMIRMVLIGLGDSIKRGDRSFIGRTASIIKKYLHELYPVTLNNTLNSIKQLKSLGLIKCCGITKKRGLNLYQPTIQGWKIYEELKK